MNRTPTSERLHAIRLITRAVWIEAIRRKDLWVVVFLMGLFVVGGGIFRLLREGTPAESQFLMNLGMTVAWNLSAVLTVFFGGRQIPSEIENRTLYPLLAKPVRRIDLIIGKITATGSVGAALILLFTIVSLVEAGWISELQIICLLQTLWILCLALLMLSAVIVCLTLWLPAPVAYLLVLGFFFLGAMTMNALQDSAPEALRSLIGWTAGYLPDFKTPSKMITRFTDGGAPLGPVGFLVFTFAALLQTALFTTLGAWTFRRKAL